MNKKSICLPISWYKNIKEYVTTEELGKLISDAFEYAENGTNVSYEEKHLAIIWNNLKMMITGFETFQKFGSFESAFAYLDKAGEEFKVEKTDVPYDEQKKKEMAYSLRH